MISVKKLRNIVKNNISWGGM